MINNYYEINNSIGDTEAVIILVHGIGEHIGRYKHVFKYFNKNNISVAAFDLRGHGRTKGRRGYSPDYDSMLDDIAQFLLYVKIQFKGVPVILYGHSMGGNLLANFVMKYSPDVAGVILSCPGLQLGYDAGRFKLLLAKIFWRIVPGLTVKNVLDVKYLSRDPVVIENYINDDLTHNRISIRFALETMAAGKWALDNAEKFNLPLLLMQASKDKIVDVKKNIEFARSVSGPCEIKEWPGLYHELHNEHEYEQVLEYVLHWIKKIYRSDIG